MAVRIDENICRGCGACMDICPGDLIFMALNRARLRKERECWQCMSCAKVCPERAIKGNLPFVLADYGASLWPENDPNGLHWICRHADGRREEFA